MRFRGMHWLKSYAWMSVQNECARYIEMRCKNQTRFVISCDLFFVSDSMGAANIVNWNHFDCVVTHTVRLYASVESAAMITGGHWCEYAWLKICTCESIIGFAILRGTTGGDVKKSAVDFAHALLLPYNFTDSHCTSFFFKDRTPLFARNTVYKTYMPILRARSRSSLNKHYTGYQMHKFKIYFKFNVWN